MTTYLIALDELTQFQATYKWRGEQHSQFVTVSYDRKWYEENNRPTWLHVTVVPVEADSE